jgi:soluble lytic murein transglycosylase-like protein
MKKVLFVFLMFISNSAISAEFVRMFPNIPWDNPRKPCWEEAGKYHGVNPWLLYAIAKVESGYNPNAVSPKNRNGTVDLGLMQINSAHLPRLKKYGIPEIALKNACASTYIGAWVLADGYKRYGNSWKAIASYNVGSVGTPRQHEIGLNYAKKFMQLMNRL